jgi:hypothetical protein
MPLDQAIITQVPGFVAGALVTILLFIFKRSNEQTDKRQKAAVKFLAKINECLIDVKLRNNSGAQCICQESYAEFRLTVAGAEATELEGCWNDYIVQKETSGTRCVECLECLHRLVHQVTKSKSSSRVSGCVSCGSP